MTLVQSLERTCKLLETSEDSDWTSWTAREIYSELSEILDAINAGNSYDRDKLAMLFLPTGPVQETSMANDWSDEMLKLADVVDQQNNP